MKYSDSIKRINEIVNVLQRGCDDVDEAISLFEEGQAQIRSCEEKIEQATGRFQELTRTPETDADLA